MKIGIIISVRMSSERLPGKVLKKIKGKEIIKYIYERLETTNIDKKFIVFATSDDTSDDIIEKFCRENSYLYFRGSKNNVADRLLNCAKEFRFDAFIRICGDNVFADKGIINSMIEIYKKGSYEVVTNTFKRTFPYGMSVEIINTEFYEGIYPKITDSSEKEHVTKFIYKNFKKFNIYNYKSENKKYKNIKLSLDTKKDFEIIKEIINSFKKDHRKYDIDDIVNLYYSIFEHKLET
jgi:spore coat polysaccharide biosynthesis protein SpsF